MNGEEPSYRIYLTPTRVLASRTSNSCVDRIVLVFDFTNTSNDTHEDTFSVCCELFHETLGSERILKTKVNFGTQSRTRE